MKISSVKLACVLVVVVMFCEGGSADNLERTMVMIKPDGVERGLVGEIIQRFEHKGFKLVGMKLTKGTEDQFKTTYSNIADKPFFPSFVKYMASGPVISMVWEGVNAVETARHIVGTTNPSTAAPGTIRSDLSINIARNVIHSASSVETANSEIAFWFKTEELVAWQPAVTPWLY